MIPEPSIREIFIRRSVIGGNNDEAAIADHIDQNFHPHGHDAPLPLEKLRKGGVSSCMNRRSDTRDRMARDYAGLLDLCCLMKNLLHSKVQTRSFMPSPDPRDTFGHNATGRQTSAGSPQRQNGRPDPFSALARVVSQYSSRARSNFCWVSLKLATRAAIWARSRASLFSFSVIAHPSV